MRSALLLSSLLALVAPTLSFTLDLSECATASDGCNGRNNPDYSMGFSDATATANADEPASTVINDMTITDSPPSMTSVLTSADFEDEEGNPLSSSGSARASASARESSTNAGLVSSSSSPAAAPKMTGAAMLMGGFAGAVIYGAM